jgi:hypothetical protein
MTAIAPRETTEIVPGYSPKPARIATPLADDSPSPSDSPEPSTEDPGGILEGPDLTPRNLLIPDSSEFSVRDGVVTFS